VSPPGDATRVQARFRIDRGPAGVDVALDVPARGVTALFGPSGSGKTTCLRVLSGLERATGVVRVGDETWQDDEHGVFVPTERRRVGFVFQDAALFAHMTVRGNLDYGRRRSRAPVPERDVAAILELLGLGPLLDRRPHALSGGERRRVAIGRALLAGSRLLLLDEPMAGLDRARRAELFPFLERLRDETNTPILYVTHELGEVARLANHVVLLEGGRVRASGALAELLGRLDLSIAGLDDAGVVLEGCVESHDEDDALTKVTLGPASLWVGRVDRPLGARVRVRVLARDVSLARDAPGPSSILNVLAARVTDVVGGQAHDVNVRLSIGEPGIVLLARVTRRSCEALRLEAGTPVHALVKSVALLA
jgi:molybdate transport system ATP-binding protein